MTISARAILELLTEDPKAVFRQFSAMQATKTEAEVLLRFKQSAAAYIEWAAAPDAEAGYVGYDPSDLRALRRVETFQDAEAILAKYDGEPTFLSMCAEGYFV